MYLLYLPPSKSSLLHMNTFRTALAAVLLLVSSHSFGQDYSHARIHLGDGSLQPLAELGLALDHVHYGPDYVEGDFSRFGITAAKDAGYLVEILAADASVAYQHQAPVAHHSARSDESCVQGLTSFDVVTPSEFSLGSYQGNFTYQEMLDELDRMRARYPDLISVRQPIGDYKTYEGRPIYWLRISDHPDQDEAEPEILYTAVHHAREPVSLTQLIYYMWYLLENAQSNASIAHLLANTELYFLPCLNPDGYVYNETIQPSGGGMWRKNRRPNADGSFGVDLNRNYGHKWGHNNAGSSANPQSEVYRGPAPFSEPETQAVRDFVLDHDFKIALNYHTYGGFLIYPYGYTDQPAEDLDIFQELAMLLTQENRYVYGTGLETIAYTTNGDADDWMYGERAEKASIFSMTPEVGTSAHGFWPHPSDVEHLCQASLQQNLDAALFLLNSGRLIDESEAHLTELSGRIPFRVTKLGFEDVGLRLTATPITDNIQFSQPSKLYILSLFSKERGQLDYHLSPDIVDGERIQFVLTLDNGDYARHDTITKYYQEQRFALQNPGSLSDWDYQSDQHAWGISDRVFYSPPHSLTDSPNGNYIPHSENYLTLLDPLTLVGTDSAVLTFRALWDIQHRFDYLAVEISTDGVLFQPLCAKHSTAALASQVFGQPVFSGRQLDWVNEHIDLTDYLGETITIRFAMISTNSDTRDGFYLDDIKVLQFNQGDPTRTRDFLPEDFTAMALPNPADDLMTIRTDLQPATQDLRYLLIHNHLGQPVAKRPFHGEIRLDISDWPAGFYFYQFEDASGRRSIADKIIVH